MILVDSSVWIGYFNGQDCIETAFLADCIAEERPLTLPGIVLTEVLFGVRNDAEARRVSYALSAYPLAPELTEADYAGAAQIYRTCRSRGRTIRSTIDCLIAQLCLRESYELLARDRDFEAIAAAFPLKRTPGRNMVHDRTA